MNTNELTPNMILNYGATNNNKEIVDCAINSGAIKLKSAIILATSNGHNELKDHIYDIWKTKFNKDLNDKIKLLF